MTDADILAELGPVFAGVFGRDNLSVTPATTAADIAGWDSFRQIDLMIAVEERFGIRLRTREIDRLGSVGDLVTLIAGKRVAS